jgi:two-component system osmolarity sensor histidine kinase EnvZ
MRGAIGLGLAVVVFLLAAAWLSRIVARPFRTCSRESGSLPRPANAAALAQRGPVELRQLAQQFDAFAAQRVQQDDARAMMLAGISHDLRSPLGRIRMAAELLPEAPGVAVRREALRNAQLADELVGSFIALVRTATEPLDERVELHALVRELLGNGDHADVHARLPAEGEALWVEPASRIVLQRCLLNLLDNARRYGRPPLEVDLQAQGRGRAERA